MGDMRLVVDDRKGGRRRVLYNTLYVPDLRTNLLSVSKMTDNGHEMTFKGKQSQSPNPHSERRSKLVLDGTYRCLRTNEYSLHRWEKVLDYLYK